MTPRRVDLPAGVAGALWLSAMPGRDEPWPAFEQRARDLGLAEVVCLAARDEMPLAYRAAVDRATAPFRWRHLPVRNLGVPDDAADFRRQVQQMAAALRAGDALLLHCAAGIGRTGSTAACVLKALGLPTDEALRRVRAAGSNPQNAEQSGWVEWF